MFWVVCHVAVAVRRLDIPALASLLGNVIEERHYKTGSRHVRWSVDSESSRMVSEAWVKILWSFIHSEIDRLSEAEGKDLVEVDLKVRIPTHHVCMRAIGGKFTEALP